MDELQEKLTAFLQNPQAMEQVMEMAASLGLGGESSEGSSSPANRQEELVHALMPYLRPQRRARLRRALELARLSTLATQAMAAQLQQREQEGQEHV